MTICLPGGTGDYIQTPAAAAFDFTTGFDLRAEVLLNDWTPTTSVSLIEKAESQIPQPTDAWRFAVSGNTLQGHTGATGWGGTVGLNYVDGVTQKWLRMVYRSTGPRQRDFYTSDDGAAWALHESFSDSGNTPVPVTAQDVRIGRWLAGKVFALEIRDAAGAVVSSRNLRTLSAGATSFLDDQGRTWTLVGGAVVCLAAAAGGWPGGPQNQWSVGQLNVR